MIEKKKLLTAAAGVAIATGITAPVDAKVTLVADEPSGWSFSVDGNVNAFYVYSTGNDPMKGQATTTYGATRISASDVARIQTGLLPSKFGFGVSGPASNGVTLRGYFGLYPQIQNGNTKTARGAQVDMREIYAAASGDFGEILFGRTLSLFQRNAIVQDMTLFGVGATGNNVGNGGTTLGRIGFGYVYPDFNAGIRYTTPALGSASLSLGLFDPSRIRSTAGSAAAAASFNQTETPRFEGELNIDLSNISAGSNLVFSGIYQEADGTERGNTSGGDVSAEGIHVGGTLVGGPYALTAHYYNGECLGSTVQLDVDAVAADGTCRDNDGFYVQATYNYGDGKIGVSYGESNVDQAGGDSVDTFSETKQQSMYTVGVYHNLAPEWLAVAELSQAENEWYQYATGEEDGESSIFAVGMFYLW
jgi:predicted porin